MSLKTLLLFVLMLVSGSAICHECGIGLVKDYYEQSEFVVIAENINAKVGTEEFELDYAKHHEQINASGDIKKRLKDDMQRYYKTYDYSSFIVKWSFKGSLTPGKKIKIIDYITRKKALYTAGDSFLLFLTVPDKSQDSYLADVCFFLNMDKQVVENYTDIYLGSFGRIVNEVNELSER